MTVEPSPLSSVPLSPFYDRIYAMEKCKYYKKCGGCDSQGLSYEKQLSKKQSYIENLLAPVLLKNGYKKEEVSKLFFPIIGAENPYHYRNKVHGVFGVGRNKKTICGTYEKNSHHVVDIENCQIENETAVKMIRGIKDMMSSFKLAPFDEDRRTGVMRHVLIRVGEKVTGDGSVSPEYMVVLVTGSKEFPGKKNFVKELVKRYPEITTVVWNINDKKTSMILGEKEEVLYGNGFVTDTLLGMNYRISSKSFYQVNKKQTEKLYQTAMEFAGDSSELLLDAYCGTGTIGMSMAHRAKKVIGVELNKAAVKDAKQNAKENGIKNIEFVCGDAGEYLLGVTGGRFCVTPEGCDTRTVPAVTPDVVIMDPPRSGSSKDFLNSLLKIKPERIVYVSCGPESLKRDLEYLLRPKHGKRLYRLEAIQPIDMFPMTKHTEICLKLVKA